MTNATAAGTRKDRLARNLQSVRQRIAAACDRAGRVPESVCLVAVTKSVSVEVIRELYELGLRDIAENRPQALWERQPLLPPDIRWHFIGHLQTNKVKRTLQAAKVVHSVDRPAVADAIANEAAKLNVNYPVFVEVNVTGEESKGGFSPDEFRLVYPQWASTPNLELRGLMTMARLEDEPDACRETFAALRQLRDELRRGLPHGPKLAELSMGMSGDFEVAIEEGATHVRIGSALFEGLPNA